MARQYEVSVPRPAGTDSLLLILESGHSVVIIGANGSGKTRLGVHLEDKLHGKPVQRIPAHKSLTMSDAINVISLERADNALRVGHEGGQAGLKSSHRWGGKPATHLLSDFDSLMQRLFAEQNRAAVGYLHAARSDPKMLPPTTQLQMVKAIWDELLPHRMLLLREAAVEVRAGSPESLVSYAGSNMSDGERAIFYFLGQCLVAPPDSAIIVDEPEAHVHRAILGRLWDAIEEARPDCAFVYITHDLDFAIARPTSQKFYIRSYDPVGSWDIAELPEDTGLPDNVVAELVGSRRPILFVEGDRGSIDLTVYQHQYAAFTIVPIGSCGAVLHSVASYNGSAALHWLSARGLVDSDHRTFGDVTSLERRGVYVLPVAEVENLLLLPGVFVALAEALSCADPAARLATLTGEVMKVAARNVDLVAVRYATRQIDYQMKRIELEAHDLKSLQSSYQDGLAQIEPTDTFNEFKARFQASIDADDLESVLKLYDNKGLLALAANTLGIKGPRELMERVGRLLGATTGAKLRDELAKVLPSVLLVGPVQMKS